MRRIDSRLVELGLAPSRTKAQQMILAGEVEIFSEGTWREVTRVSELAETARVTGHKTLRYVSRGGLKLEAALDRLNLDVRGLRVLDVGQSTGGFTDCLLQRGSAAVLGVDVGHDQLHPRVREDVRVTALEGVHVRDLAQSPAVRSWCANGLDLVVADLSFISITKILPALVELNPTRSLLLIKPQFEAGPKHLNRRGVITDPAVWDVVRGQLTAAFVQHQFTVADYFACDVKGQDGNQEFFALVHARDHVAAAALGLPQ